MVVRHRRLAARDDCHACPAHRMPADRRFHFPVTLDVPVSESGVLARHAVRLELAHEVGLSDECLRDDEKAACVLVQPMDDPRTRHFRERRRMLEQRVQERPVPVAAAWMNDEAGRLIDDDQRSIFENDVKWNVLGRVREHLGIGRRDEMDLLAAEYLVPWSCRPAVDGDSLGADPCRETAARMLGQETRERLVEPQARAVVGCDEYQRAVGIVSAIIRATHAFC
jgi:hypothetical protein